MRPNGRRLFTVVLALAAALWLPPARAADGAPKLRLLIIEGISNHDWPRRLAMVREVLARDGSFEVDVSITPPDAGDPGAVLLKDCVTRLPVSQTFQPRFKPM